MELGFSEYLDVTFLISRAESENDIARLEDRINALPDDEKGQIWEQVMMRFPRYQSSKRELST
jgi:hypothetical protein